MDTEKEVQEVEGPGLGYWMISRRNLIKGGAIVGGTVWVAPAIESFANKAFAASVAHACCQCYNVLGQPIGAAQDDFSDAGCATTCAAAPGLVIPHGSFLRFVDGATQFGAIGDNCFYPSNASTPLGGTPTACPGTLPAGVTCDVGVF